MTGRARKLIVLGLVVVLLSGASPRRTWLRVQRDHTRELVIYDGFTTALLLRATLLTPDVRVALAGERARLLAPPADDVAAFAARMKADGASFHEVVFAADSGVLNEARGFGPGDDRWNVRLEVDGAAAELVEVMRISDPSPLHEALYPQVDQWGDLWIARFVRAASDPHEVVLQVGSGYGNGTVRWEGLGG